LLTRLQENRIRTPPTTRQEAKPLTTSYGEMIHSGLLTTISTRRSSRVDLKTLRYIGLKTKCLFKRIETEPLPVTISLYTDKNAKSP